MGPGVDIADDFVQVVEYQDGHDWSEDFFLHHGISKCDIVHDCGFDAKGFAVGFSAVHDLFSIDQAEDPVEMFFVDDFSVICVFQRLFAVLLLDLFLYFFDQFVLDGSVAVNVIRGHAGLAAVQIFAEDDSSGGQPDICGSIHDAGAFSAKFQCNRSQMFCGAAHDFFANGLASGKEDIIEMFF